MKSFRLKSPLYAQIELTYACNLACTHCYNEPRFSNADGLVKLRRVKKKAARGKCLTAEEFLRNKRISKIRCRGEHVYGTMTRSLKSGRTKLTTTTRVFVQQIFVCLAYNLHRLKFLLKYALA